jgi:hypothetical protein
MRADERGRAERDRSSLEIVPAHLRPPPMKSVEGKRHDESDTECGRDHVVRRARSELRDDRSYKLRVRSGVEPLHESSDDAYHFGRQCTPRNCV